MSETDKPRFEPRFSAPTGHLEPVAPGIRRYVCANPGPFTFTGTCAYVIGEGETAVLDPGPDDADGIDRLLAQMPGERVGAILVTHTHRDHAPGARLLQARTGAPIRGCAPYVPPAPGAFSFEERGLDASHDRGYRPDHVVEDGETLEAGGMRLTALATPGHAANHLCFALEGADCLFSGDHVMAWSTSVVAPPDGAMGDYMASLERIRSRPETVYWPGHGGPVRDAPRFARALLAHRRQREGAILAILAQGPTRIEGIVERSYAGLDPKLKGAAALSTLAHLQDLAARGAVVSDAGLRLDALYALA